MMLHPNGNGNFTGDVAKLLKGSAKVAHVNMWNISIIHDDGCVSFLALRSEYKILVWFH